MLEECTSTMSKKYSFEKCIPTMLDICSFAMFEGCHITMLDRISKNACRFMQQVSRGGYPTTASVVYLIR